MLSDEIRHGLNDGKESTFYAGLIDLKQKVMDDLKPDTVIVIDAHWGTIVEFIVSAHGRRAGKYTSEELPRGMCQVPYNLKGSPDLANAIAMRCSANGVRTSTNADPYLPIQYPTVNLAHFLRDDARDEEWGGYRSAGRAILAIASRLEEAFCEAVEASNKRVVIMASGALSHVFWPLKELEKHDRRVG